MPLAGADQPEIGMADQIGDRRRDRLQQLLRRLPAPQALQRQPLRTAGDLRVALVPRQQQVERAELRLRRGGERLTGMAADEGAQPFPQGPGPFGHDIQLDSRRRVGAEFGGGARVYEIGALEPVQELGTARQKLGGDPARRRMGVEKVHGRMVADQRDRWCGFSHWRETITCKNPLEKLSQINNL